MKFPQLGISVHSLKFLLAFLTGSIIHIILRNESIHPIDSTPDFRNELVKVSQRDYRDVDHKFCKHRNLHLNKIVADIETEEYSKYRFGLIN